MISGSPLSSTSGPKRGSFDGQEAGGYIRGQDGRRRTLMCPAARTAAILEPADARATRAKSLIPGSVNSPCREGLLG